MDHTLRHTGNAPADEDLPSAVPSSPPAAADDGAKVTHGYVVSCDLSGETLPNIKEWVALLRAYLGPEINAILFDDEKT